MTLSVAEAAAIGVPYITAGTVLTRAGTLKPGETVLITGATGAVDPALGFAEVRAVKLAGFTMT